MTARHAAALAALALMAWTRVAAEPSIDVRDGAGRVSTLPRPAILLFWAEWCAPCRNEVRLLPELTTAAAPMPVIVVPVDESTRTRYLLKALPPTQVAYVATGGYRLLSTFSPQAAGLPVAVVTGGSGGTCELKLGAMSVADARAWAAKCGTAIVH